MYRMITEISYERKVHLVGPYYAHVEKNLVLLENYA